MENIRKIYPTNEQLSVVHNLLKCTEDACPKVFRSESNLMLHLVKTHRQNHLMPIKGGILQFYCPDLNCNYNSKKFFKTMKLVKQHYLKVHSSRHYVCRKCDKGFSTESAKNYHTEFCGVNFKCCDCNTSYSSYETLKTHGRRKHHNVLQKHMYKSQLSPIITQVSESKVNNNPLLLMPKTANSFRIIIIPTDKKIAMSNTSTQTDEIKVRKPLKKQNSRETQTGKGEPKLSAETQTVGKFVSKKPPPQVDDFNDPVLDAPLRNSIKIQTCAINSKSISCNTSFNFSDLDFIATKDTEKYSSGTQTSFEEDLTSNSNLPSASNMEIDGFCDNFDSNFFNCNMETQTDFIFSDEFLNCDYYSKINMCTQTCEDMLLNDIGFSDIETQTVFDDMLRSVKSQTLMSSTQKDSCRYMSHGETQTETEFEKMLEEINA